MKKLLLNKSLLLFFTSQLFIFNIYAQTPTLQWVKQGGSTSADNGERCTMDNFKNVIYTGDFQGTATFEGTTLTSAGSKDIFVAKYDSAGNLSWVKRFGGTGNDGGYSVATDGFNIYITGWFSGTMKLDTMTVTSHGNQDVFIAMIDYSGTPQWIKHGGSNNGASIGLNITVDRSLFYVYATGYVATNSSFDTVNLANAYVDVFLSKYQATNGQLQWVKKAGGPSDDYGVGVTTDKFGYVYLVGYVKAATSFDSLTVNSTAANHTNFLAKYTSSGKPIWVKTAEGVSPANGSAMSARSVVVDDAGANIYVLADIAGTTVYDTVNLVTGFCDISLAAYDSSGNFKWVKQFGGSSTEWSGELQIDKTSHLYAIGSFTSVATFGNTTLTSRGNKDMFIAEFDSSGNVAWVLQGGGTGEDLGRGLAIDSSGAIYATGAFTGAAMFGSTSLIGYGGMDAYVLKLKKGSSDIAGLRFDGTDDYATVPHNNAYDFGFGNFTLEATVNLDALQTASNYPALLSTRLTGNTNSGFLLFFFQGQLSFQTNGVNHDSSPNGDIRDGKCHHVAVVRSSTSLLSWYIDGQLTTTNTAANYNITTSGPIMIGNDLGGNLTGPLKGTIQEVRIWNVARSQSQILNSKDIQLLGNETGLVGYWRLNDGSGQSITDYSSTNNAGTLGSTLTPDINDPTFTASCHISIINGVENSNYRKDIIIYPNPSNGTFTINSGNILNGELTIYNSIGQSILYRDLNSVSETSISIATPGIYFVNVRNEENQYTQKIIIQ